MRFSEEELRVAHPGMDITELAMQGLHPSSVKLLLVSAAPPGEDAMLYGRLASKSEVGQQLFLGMKTKDPTVMAVFSGQFLQATKADGDAAPAPEQVDFKLDANSRVSFASGGACESLTTFKVEKFKDLLHRLCKGGTLQEASLKFLLMGHSISGTVEKLRVTKKRKDALWYDSSGVPALLELRRVCRKGMAKAGFSFVWLLRVDDGSLVPCGQAMVSAKRQRLYRDGWAPLGGN